MQNLRDVFEHEIKDLYSAESQLVKALPKMVKGAASAQLREALQFHLGETEMHIKRLEEVGEMCGVSLRGQKCKGMEGLIAEGAGLLEKAKTDARDAALISAAQRVEHYEIAAYGSAVAFATQLDLPDAATLLEQTLAEEKAADIQLSEIASSAVNPGAAQDEDTRVMR
jgi:ferritin-like metal-binding protein YciE